MKIWVSLLFKIKDILKSNIKLSAATGKYDSTQQKKFLSI